MKIMKLRKLISAALTAALLMSPIGASAYSAGAPSAADAGVCVSGDYEEKTSGNYTYAVLDDNTAMLTKFLGSGTNVVIPGEIDGLPVSALSNTFYGCSAADTIESITIPDSVKTVGGSTFAILKSLKTVLFSDTVETIEQNAFRGCASLEEVRLPSSLTSIGDYAFFYCESLRNVIIPDSVTDVGFLAFEGTPWLAEHPADFVTVGDGVLICYKGSDAEPSIPDTVKKIGAGAFSIAQTMSDKGSSSTSYIMNVSIPDSVTEIGDYAFSRNYLSEITIPSSVKVIGDSAFRFTDLTTVSIPSTVRELGSGCFTGCENLTTATIADGATVLGENFFRACTALTSVSLPESLTELGNDCFAYCSALKSITLGEKLKTIGDEAFYTCEELESITIPASVETLGSNALGSCKKLARVDFSGMDTSWESPIFVWTYDVTVYCYSKSNAHQCAKNEKVNIVLYDPDSDTEDATGSDTEGDKTTDSDKSSDTSPASPDGFEYEYDSSSGGIRILKYTGSDKNVVIPSEIDGQKVTVIGEQAFIDCPGIETLTFPETLRAIEGGAFIGCVSLKSADIPDSVEELGAGAFLNCDSLESVRISDSVNVIYPVTFSNCPNLKDVIIPPSVQSIDESAFDAGCGAAIHCAEGSYAETFAISAGLDAALDYSERDPGKKPEPETDPEVKPEPETDSDITPKPDLKPSVSGTIKFDPGEWRSENILFMIYDETENDVAFATKDGWVYDYPEDEAQVMGTKLPDGTFESYEFTITEGHIIYLEIIDPANPKVYDTYDLNLTEEAFGKTVTLTGRSIVTNERDNIVYQETEIKGTDLKSRLYFDYDGNLIGEQKHPNDNNGAFDVAILVYGFCRHLDEDGNSVVTPEKVKAAINAFGTTEEAVYEAYKDFKGYGDRYDEEFAKSVIFSDSPDPLPHDPVKAGIYGDLDGDELITANDALKILRASIGLEMLSETQLTAANVDGDSAVTSSDALAVLRESVGFQNNGSVGKPFYE